MTDWHKLTTQESLNQLGSSPAGLTTEQSRERLERFGPNRLHETGLKSPWLILWEQLTGVLVVVLIFAAVVSAVMGYIDERSKPAPGWAEGYSDAIAILVIVVLNALLGLSQEYRAEKAMAALKKLAAPVVRVRRDGELVELPSPELVPGDVLLLEAGNLVPADCRLLETANLRIQEAALTGESEPVDKTVAPLPADLPPADRTNMAYMGTVVTYGRGLALAVQTGMDTQLGSIATMMQTVRREPTPLQKRLEQLGKGLALAALALVAVIFAQGLIIGGTGLANIEQMFLTAVSMAVAAVPEGLPAVVTIALALGAQRMLRRRALIRKLLAVETLGSVTVICSDKTGTLTENRMKVTVLDLAGDRADLAEPTRRGEPVIPAVGRAYVPDIPNASVGQVCPTYHANPTLSLLLAGAALCNDATLKPGGEAGRANSPAAIGDPTETALVVAAADFGLWKDRLEKLLPRTGEVPFDSERKRMTTVHALTAGALADLRRADMPEQEDLNHKGHKEHKEGRVEEPETLAPLFQSFSRLLRELCVLCGSSSPAPPQEGAIAFCKGAADSVLSVCSAVWKDDRPQPLDDQARAEILAANDRLAKDGMRVLGVAVGLPPAGATGQAAERDMVFLGLAGMIDPPRAEVKQAVATCRSAGIRPVMITGDHPLTALHVARQLGIDSGDDILTGRELSAMSAEQLRQAAPRVSLYARVQPEQKLRIVEALQSRGEVVAMTGDGVNDAPALRKSDIGVAMGITGTDVAKEASDMVLQDDNFATIVAAVEEGRVIYDNIRKFIKYLLSCNSGELWVMIFSRFLGMPLPLLPLQILLMNLVTDGLPALALGVEPGERHTMRRPPIRPGDNIFRGMTLDIIWIGCLMAAISLGLGAYCWFFRQCGFAPETLARFAGEADPAGEAHAAYFRTMVFTTLTLSQMALVLAQRSNTESLFRQGLRSNLPLLWAVLATVAIQLAVIYVPALQQFFYTVPLTAGDLALALGLTTIPFWAVELQKLFLRRRAGFTSREV